MARIFVVHSTILVCFAASLTSCEPGPCDLDHAERAARDVRAEYADRKKYQMRVEDRGQHWKIELFDPDAGTGGQAFFTIDKRSCKIVDWIGFQ